MIGRWMSRTFPAGSYTFDDFAVGDRFVTPAASMTEAQIVDAYVGLGLTEAEAKVAARGRG